MSQSPACSNGSCHRIVLTGGPGGGKTTAADLFRREIGDSVVIVPEAATMLFAGGFPRNGDPNSARAAQKAVYHVQRNLEDVQTARYPHRTLLCDRGTVDSAVYWPDGPEAFFKELNTSLEAELARYDAIIFFESAAVGNISIEGGNPIRTENIDQALQLDHALKNIWQEHSNFHFVPHQPSFFKKLQSGLQVLQSLVEHKST